MIYLELFLEFFKASCFTFGGAYGAIPLIRDMVLSHNWLSQEQLTHMIAVSESTPGPIMVNLATYIGSTQGGFWGSLIATVAVVLPAYLVILLVMGLLKNLIAHPYAQAVLRGLKPCVTGIVLATGLYMAGSSCVSATAIDLRSTAITALLILAMAGYRQLKGTRMSPLVLIAISAGLGILVYGGLF